MSMAKTVLGKQGKHYVETGISKDNCNLFSVINRSIFVLYYYCSIKKQGICISYLQKPGKFHHIVSVTYSIFMKAIASWNNLELGAGMSMSMLLILHDSCLLRINFSPVASNN